jgi:hypothetical protein
VQRQTAAYELSPDRAAVTQATSTYRTGDHTPSAPQLTQRACEHQHGTRTRPTRRTQALTCAVTYAVSGGHRRNAAVSACGFQNHDGSRARAMYTFRCTFMSELRWNRKSW